MLILYPCLLVLFSSYQLGVGMDWIFKNPIHIYLNELDLIFISIFLNNLDSRSNLFKWIWIWLYSIYIHLNYKDFFIYKF